MSRNKEQPDSARGVGYQPHDLRGWWVAAFVGGFALLMAAAQFGLWRLTIHLANHLQNQEKPKLQIAASNEVPSPALQPSVRHDVLPRDDLEAMRKFEDAQFERLGWQVDRRTHRVRVPDAIVKRVASRTESNP